MGAKIGLIVEKTILPETSDHSPSMAFFEGRLFIAWKGSANDTLNVAFSQLLNPGVRPVFDLERKHISAETSDNAPALAFHPRSLEIQPMRTGADRCCASAGMHSVTSKVHSAKTVIFLLIGFASSVT